MTTGSTRNYKVGPKNNWRRTKWNDILRRTNGREKAELSLYLAGPDDLDRYVAVNKGVPEANLIAIDRARQNVETIRSSGHTAIHGDILKVLESWPTYRRACVLDLDFCSGLPSAQDFGRLMALRLMPSFRDAVLAVNFQRGRDGHLFARMARQYTDRVAAHSTIGFGRFIGSPRHRGAQFFYAYLNILTWVQIKAGLLKGQAAGAFATLLSKTMGPEFFSYRSGVLVFDSVVLSPLTPVVNYREPDEEWARIGREFQEPSQSMRRQIAAAFAVRTRRLEAR